MNQNQGVYVATMNVLADNGISFDDGVTLLKDVLTEKMTKDIIAIVNAGLVSGEIEMSAEARVKYAGEKMMKYTPGLVNNHHRKDKRFTGGAEYVAKNPGSRAGCGDDQLKALKVLKASRTDAADIAVIDQAIAARQAELKASKTVELTAEQIALIPESLRSLLKV